MWKKTSKKQQGFNLIENLITLFILTVGLLGVAGLQAMAMKAQQTSHHYDRALSLAQEMADRVRANRKGAMEGYYDLKSDSYPSSYNEQADCVTADGCTPEEMAEHDLWEWFTAIERDLPKGAAFICRDSVVSQDSDDYAGDPDTIIPGSCDGSSDTYVVHIVWDMDPKRDGVVTLRDDPQESDGHLWMAFEP